LDANLKQVESARIETEYKLEKIAKRLKVTKEKNLELHNIISKIRD
jgi:hypothetical protein